MLTFLSLLIAVLTITAVVLYIAADVKQDRWEDRKSR